MADVRYPKLVAKLMLGACAFVAFESIACRSQTETDGTSSPGTSASPGQLKPATARVAAETEPIADPGQEPADLPRGVSPPQPAARDVAAEPKAAPTLSADPVHVAVPKAPPAPLAKAKPVSTGEPVVTKAKPPVIGAPLKPVQLPEHKASPIAREPAPVQPAAPVVPPPPPAAPVAPPKVSVRVPQTDHVHVEVPSGLQHWLDEDDRMRPWLSKAVNVADSCYAKVREDNQTASGVIAFVVTMHENARPSGSVSSVSGPINGIIMCATTRLFGVKMPLFTGNESESYSVRVRFDP